MIPPFSAQAANSDVDLLTPIKRVIESHWYILGHEVTQFEAEFAAYCGVSHCVTVANGTDALELALRAVGVESGDTVALVANAGFYGSTAVRLVGALPQYVDIDPTTLTMSVESLRQALRHLPKAIIVTHLYGRLADIETIVDLASSAGIPVIEDCAQAHGAQRGGKRAGSFGTAACFSFYPTKNLGALGDGGAIVSDDESITARVRRLRQYGWGAKYQVACPGGRNSRLDEIQAAILREKLPRLDGWNAARREIARRYNQAFANLPMQCPVATGDDYVAHLYVAQVDRRDEFREHLRRGGIATDIHYPIPDHRQPGYPSSDVDSLPATESACARVVSLPCYPGLKMNEVDQVVHAVHSYFELSGT